MLNHGTILQLEYIREIKKEHLYETGTFNL